jgi:hypothetical protein
MTHQAQTHQAESEAGETPGERDGRAPTARGAGSEDTEERAESAERRRDEQRERERALDHERRCQERSLREFC